MITDITLAKYFVQNNCTVREVAKQFGISKTTVHKRLREYINKEKHNIAEAHLALQVETLFEKNKRERTIRGGEALRQKYLNLKLQK